MRTPVCEDVVTKGPTEGRLQPPLAYLDPGSGSLLLQLILGGIAAAGVTAKLTWGRLLRRLGIRKDHGAQA
jgi:hypothetical protein